MDKVSLGRLPRGSWIKRLSVIVCIIFIIANTMLIVPNKNLITTVSGSTLYVGGSNPGNYSTIQEAINAANPGDTVFVYSGTYYQHVIVNKNINLTGENRNTTIIDGQGNIDVVRVESDWVNITGFTVTGSGSGPGDSALEIENVQNCRITDNNISSNNGSGISLYMSDGNSITGNIVSFNINGISLLYSNRNNITDNTASLNEQIGVLISESRECKIINNHAENNRYGINLHSGNIWNTINGNNVSSNSDAGIFLYFASNENTINGNNASYNGGTGIDIAYSWINTLADNEVFFNDRYGIHIRYSIESSLTNNTMINDGIFIEGDSLEFWNTHHIDTSNMINGKPMYYLKNQTVGIIPPGAGEVILANCSDILVENQELNYSTVSVELGYSFNNNIMGNNASNNDRQGIFLYYADGNNITDNNFSLNGWYSVDLRLSNTNNISDNNILSNGEGNMRLTDSNGNNILDNKVLNSIRGIMLMFSGGNAISGNDILQNSYFGISLQDSSSNTITDCLISSSTNSGIILRNSSSTTIDNCTIHNNPTGVYLMEHSMDNTLINSSITDSGNYDIYFSDVLGGNSHATLLNTTFDKSKVYYGDPLSDLMVLWFMYVNVIYFNGTPVGNAQIWVNDTNGNNLLNGPVNSEGWKRWIIVMEYMEMDTNGDHIGERIYFTPHSVAANDGVLWGYADPVMNISKVVIIYLGVAPPLLPPTNLTTKVVNSGTYVELEWTPPSSPALDHYLIYRADSENGFDFSVPYNKSITWPDPLDFTWIDPDPNVTSIDGDFYYIVRAANFDETDISSTSNTAGVWTRTFEPGISAFSLPLEPYSSQDIETVRQDMNATYIKWMDPGLHGWMKHGEGVINDTLLIQGRGYEVKFENQTRYTFCGMPGTQIKYHSRSAIGFNPTTEADSLSATVDPVTGEITLFWQQPSSMWDPMNHFYNIYRSTTRDGFFDGTAQLVASFSLGPLTWKDTIIAGSNTQYYYMIVPVNGTGFEGASSYSIGVFTRGLSSNYDAIGLPLIAKVPRTIDWYCDNIPNTVGINYHIYYEQRWGWHSSVMPLGIYDGTLEMANGYQISTSSVTKFTFIGT